MERERSQYFYMKALCNAKGLLGDRPSNKLIYDTAKISRLYFLRKMRHVWSPMRDQIVQKQSTVELRYNKGPRDWQKLFATTRFRYIEVIFHIVYYYWGKGSLQCRRILGGRNLVRVRNTVKPVLGGHAVLSGHPRGML